MQGKATGQYEIKKNKRLPCEQILNCLNVE
jgi:hypothetical protein